MSDMSILEKMAETLNSLATTATLSIFERKFKEFNDKIQRVLDHSDLSSKQKDEIFQVIENMKILSRMESRADFKRALAARLSEHFLPNGEGI